jgi:hypothetical protein
MWRAELEEKGGDDDTNKLNLICASSFGFTKMTIKAIGGARPVALTLTKPTHAGCRLGRWGMHPAPSSDSPNQSGRIPSGQSAQRQPYPITDGTNFIIPQISAKSIGNYPDIDLFLKDITPENRKFWLIKKRKPPMPYRR